MIEFRTAIDSEFGEREKLLTIASGAYQPWVNKKSFAALDYINVMCYDYDSKFSGAISQSSMEFSEEGMNRHLDMVGDTYENRRKLNLGIPFYNGGGPKLVPFYKGYDAYIDASPEIQKEKMEWVVENEYGGAFYWAYSMDKFEQDVESPDDPEVKILQRTVYEALNP